MKKNWLGKFLLLTKKIMNSNDIKSPFYTKWQMTRWKKLKNFSNFTSWTAFIHQNAPFVKTALNVLFWSWRQCTAIMKRTSVTWDYTLNHRDFLLVQYASSEPKNCLQNCFKIFHSCNMQTPWIVFSEMYGGYTG